jgi:hypothetical protein
VISTALPAAFNDNVTIELQLNGNRQVFVTVNTAALGAAALTGVVVLIEFNDNDHPEFWIPSKEGINREADSATHQWVLTGVGSWVVASRKEHRHFTKARVRFQALGGAADAATRIFTSWHHDGGRSMGELAGNDPNPSGVL